MKALGRLRREIVPQAQGTVLEIGIGTGLNLPFYNPDAVDRVFGLEPSRAMQRRAAERVSSDGLAVEFLQASAEAVPLPDDSVDTVLMTYVLCSIPEPERALGEIRRVLRAGGKFLICEHGAAPDRGVLWWQRRLNPIWKRIGGGCHLDRPVQHLLEAAGFDTHALETAYLPGPKPLTFNYFGQVA